MEGERAALLGVLLCRDDCSLEYVLSDSLSQSSTALSRRRLKAAPVAISNPFLRTRARHLSLYTLQESVGTHAVPCVAIHTPACHGRVDCTTVANHGPCS